MYRLTLTEDEALALRLVTYIPDHHKGMAGRLTGRIYQALIDAGAPHPPHYPAGIQQTVDLSGVFRSRETSNG